MNEPQPEPIKIKVTVTITPSNAGQGKIPPDQLRPKFDDTRDGITLYPTNTNLAIVHN